MKYSAKRRKPDLMTVLVLVVSLGVVITLSAQAKVNGKDGAQAGESAPLAMVANPQENLSRE